MKILGGLHAMKKRVLAVVLVLAMVFSLAACGGTTTEETGLQVGMVTDSGTIDDKSFNQGTWEGIVRASEELAVTKQYQKPVGTTEGDYVQEIQNLYDAGYKFIVTPGFMFETAIYKQQDIMTDAKFVLIDGTPNNGDYTDIKVGPNTVSVLFAEHESGFLAGVATALKVQSGELGFIGGIAVPAVQKFNWGFQQGVAYANENYGTTCNIKAENDVYQGTFSDVAAGAQLAAKMYDNGVKAIFAAAGGVGVGVINEAKSRQSKGEEVWVVGVDVDQYNAGIYDEAAAKSVVLTSAMKYLNNATFDIIKSELDGKFPGGQTLIFSVANDGVGIPTENPNLPEDVSAKVKEVYGKIKEGAVTVSDQQGTLHP